MILGLHLECCKSWHFTKTYGDSTKDRKAEELKPPMPGQEVAKPTKVQLIREMVALSGALFCKAEALYALHR